MLLRGSAGSSAQPTHPAPTAFKYLPAGVALAVMMLFGHGAVAENAAEPMVGPPEPPSHWAKDYIQHNPYMADGRDSVRAYALAARPSAATRGYPDVAARRARGAASAKPTIRPPTPGR